MYSVQVSRTLYLDRMYTAVYRIRYGVQPYCSHNVFCFNVKDRGTLGAYNLSEG
jgi:hypothetical protein